MVGNVKDLRMGRYLYIAPLFDYVTPPDALLHLVKIGPTMSRNPLCAACNIALHPNLFPLICHLALVTL